MNIVVYNYGVALITMEE